MCTYKNENFSEGSIKQFDDGHFYECFQGNWRLHQEKKSTTISLISKKPAGGAGNFIYTYLCRCDSGGSSNISITAANDIEANNLALLDCSENCSNSRKDVKEFLEIPIIEMTREIEKIKHAPTNTGNYTNYSFYDKIYRSGDRLYGSWSQSLAGVCSDSSLEGFYYEIQITKQPEIVGTCSGRYVAKIETID